MPVPVMDVGIVRVAVREHRMLVCMAVRAPRSEEVVCVLMVLVVVRVRVRVRERLRACARARGAREMEIYAGRHERAGDPEARRSGLPKACDRHRGADEGRVKK